MPELKKVLPALAEDGSLSQCVASQYRNQQVTAIKLTTGAPCASHDDLFEPWPGPESGVVEWFVLDNGYGVGKAVDIDGEEFYPVVKLQSD